MRSLLLTQFTVRYFREQKLFELDALHHKQQLQNGHSDRPDPVPDNSRHGISVTTGTIMISEDTSEYLNLAQDRLLTIS